MSVFVENTAIVLEEHLAAGVAGFANGEERALEVLVLVDVIIKAGIG